MKISHSASPRNRSSRNSRSETGGEDIAGAGSIGNGARASSASSARAGPEIRSATEVIGNRLSLDGREKNEGEYAGQCTGPAIASQVTGSPARTFLVGRFCKSRTARFTRELWSNHGKSLRRARGRAIGSAGCFRYDDAGWCEDTLLESLPA